MDTDAVAAIEFLARSETRVRLLSVLARDGQCSKQELSDAVDVSRTTIQRNLGALEDRGWITTTNSTYAITTAGEWIADDVSELVETVRNAEQLGPILDLIDPSVFGFDPREVQFEITTAALGQPQKMIDEHVRSVRAADEMRLLLPETGIRPLRATAESFPDQEGSVTLIVSEPVLETFRSTPEARECVTALQETGRFSLLVTDVEIPFYLGRLDDTVEIGVSKGGKPHALLSTTDPAVVEWAERTLAEYESTASAVD